MYTEAKLMVTINTAALFFYNYYYFFIPKSNSDLCCNYLCKSFDR